MTASFSPIDGDDHAPLLSPRFVYKVMAVVMLLAGLTAGIGIAGRLYGDNLALAGHTASTEPVDLFIGEDHLRFPANVIRFADQRSTGATERVDLYLTWPTLKGYSDADRAVFNDVNNPNGLIFLQISQSTMSRDMSGRLEPIYDHLFSGKPVAVGAGLMRHGLQENSRYGREIFLTADRPGRPTYVVRCSLPETPELATSADCQRDVHAGNDLVVLYRFSSQLLPQWRVIDDAVLAFVNASLLP